MSDIKRTITKGITTLNMKTNNFVEQNKSKTYIATLEEEIQDLQRTIGEVLYRNWKAGDIKFEDVERYFTSISEKEELIQKQQDYIKELQLQEQQVLGTENQGNVANKNVKYCSMCGAQNGADYKFCVKCGKEL